MPLSRFRSNTTWCAPSTLPAVAGLFIVLMTLLPACTQTPTPTSASVQFTLVADTSTAPLIDRLVAAYRVDRPHAAIQVEHVTNAEWALEAMQTGQAHLISVSWLGRDENDTDELWYRPFARDPIVIITHSSNPVSGLTLLQLRDIYQGQTLFWAGLGGPALDIVPVSREEGAGARLSFESLVMGRRDVTPTAVVMPSNQTVVGYVSATPGAIGYVSAAWLLPTVNLLAIEGVTPSPVSVADGRYLLARPFFLAARATPDGGLADFVNWVGGEKGQEIVRRSYAPAP